MDDDGDRWIDALYVNNECIKFEKKKWCQAPQGIIDGTLVYNY